MLRKGQSITLRDKMGRTHKITITSKAGEKEWNKHNPKTVEEFRKFARKQKRPSPTRVTMRGGENSILGYGGVGVSFKKQKGLINSNSIDDLARF